MFHSLAEWFRDPGVTIVAITVFGLLGRSLGSVVITKLIRRLIRSTYYNELSADDVRKRQDTLIVMCTVIWRLIALVVIAFLVFEQIFPQVNLTPVFASAGIIGIALGFGAQSIIKDFLTGIFLIIENQYRVGDIVDIDTAAGTVERITIRSTILRDTDGNVHFLPNGTISHVINKTMGYSRFNFILSVNPETNIDELAEVINTVGEKLAADEKWADKILEAPHFINIGSFNDVILEVNVGGKTQPSSQWSVAGEMRKRLLKTFNLQHIELAHSPLSTPSNK